MHTIIRKIKHNIRISYLIIRLHYHKIYEVHMPCSFQGHKGIESHYYIFFEGNIFKIILIDQLVDGTIQRIDTDKHKREKK